LPPTKKLSNINIHKKLQKMKKLFFLLIISMVYLQTFAVPANPDPITVTQLNGEEVTLMMRGDEFINWAVTMDGYTLLINSEFFWSYAQIDADGNLAPSPHIATEIENRSPEVIAWLQTIGTGLFYSDEQVYRYMQLREIWDMELAKGDFAKTTGDYKLLVILTQFPKDDEAPTAIERPMTKTQEDFDLLLNQIKYTTEGGVAGSAKDYYLETSYNKLNLQCSVVGPFTLPRGFKYYTPENPHNSNFNRWNQFAQHGITAAHNAGVDFTPFVSSGNLVPNVYLIYAGYDASNGCTTCIWAHASGFNNFNIGGFRFDKYACSSELSGTGGGRMAGIGTFCHEFGHTLGAPDFYDTNYATGGEYDGTGDWDIMAHGSSNNGSNTPPTHNPRTKVVTYKWATATELTTPQKVTIPVGRVYENAYFQINTPVSGQYFIIENKMREGFDGHVPGQNLLIYRCTEPYTQQAGNQTSPQRFYPVAANAPVDVPAAGANSQSQYGSISSSSTPWPGTLNKTAFTNTSIPAMITWDRQPVNKPITNIQVHGDYITFDFMGGGPKSNFHVFLPAYYGCVVTPQSGSTSPVNSGGDFSFTVDLLPTHNKSTLKITANNVVLTPSGGVYTVADIKEDKIIRIEGLEFNTFPVTATATANGTITPTGVIQVNEGGVQVFDISAENGYSIDKVLVDGEEVEEIISNIYSYTFKDVQKDHTIHATFKTGGQYTINVERERISFETYAGIPSVTEEVIISSDDIITNISVESLSPYFEFSNNGTRWYSTFMIQRAHLPYTLYVRFYPLWWGDETVVESKLTFKSTQAYNEIALHGVSNLGINDQDNDHGIVIYPNPTTGELRITNYELEITGVNVFDVYGKNVLSHTANLTPQTTINISHLSAGLYFVQVTTEAGTITKKVIKE